MSLNTDSNRTELQRLWRSRENRTAGCRREKSQRTKRNNWTRKIKISASGSGGYIPLGQKKNQPWNYTYVSIYMEPSTWCKIYPTSESAAPAQVWRGEKKVGGFEAWGLRYSTTQGGKRIRHKHTAEGFCNAHASPRRTGHADLVISLNIFICVIYCLYSCNPFQNTQEISM